MSLIDNTEKIALTSEYPTDKVVRTFKGSFNAATAFDVAGYMKRHVVNHDLTRPFIPRLKWSTDNVNWVDGGYSTRRGDTSYLPTIASTGDDYIHILTGITSGTVYYEITAVWIDDYDGSNPSIEPFHDPASPINFDSRDNLRSIFMQDELSTADANSSGELEVFHNLGYEPDVWVYFESFVGEVWPAYAGGLSNFFLYDFSNQGELDYQIYSDRLFISYSGPAPDRRIFYRIYAK